MATSSTTSARCGRSSESSAPHWPCLANLNFGPSSLELGIDERRAITLEQLRRRQGAVEFRELRLVIEQFQMARRARHEQVNDVLRLGREMRLRGASGLVMRRVGRGRDCVFAHQRMQRDRAETDAAFLQEPAAGNA